MAGDIRIPAVPDVPVHLTEHDIYTILEPLKRIIDIRQGKFDVNQRWATYQDLIDFGTLTEGAVEQPIVIIPPTSQFDFILSGDIVGGPTTLADGNDPITMPTIINLPNVVCIDGGDAAETFPPSTEGPYGVLGGGGSDLVVQDTGVSLSIAATLLNFVGFTVTEPVANQITITASPAGASSEYCPGYTFTFVDTDTFDILGVNVVNLFSVGRRIRFSIGGVDLFGEITASTFTSNTRIDVTMESGVLANVAYTVCMMTGEAGWSPIATDPFAGSSINGIATGMIGATSYWIAVGDGGKAFQSTDSGLTWTAITTSTTKNLNGVAYSPNTEEFLLVGNDRTALRSVNGTSITTLDWSTVIPAADDHFLTATWGSGQAVFYCTYHDTSSADHAVVGVQDTDLVALAANRVYNAGVTNIVRVAETGALNHHMAPITNVFSGYSNFTDTTQQSFSGWTAQGTGTAIRIFEVPSDAGNTYFLAGFANGTIVSSRGLVAGTLDTTTFSSAIRDFAHSVLHERTIAVGDNALMGYINDGGGGLVTLLGDGEFTSVNNGLNPLAHALCAAFSEDDGMFVVGASNGQIIRSTNGLS